MVNVEIKRVNNRVNFSELDYYTYFLFQDDLCLKTGDDSYFLFRTNEECLAPTKMFVEGINENNIHIIVDS